MATNRPTYVILIALLGALGGLTPLAIDMYLPALPTMAQTLSVPIEVAQYSISFYLLGFAVGQLLFGTLTDSMGRIWVLHGGLTLFALASIGCALSQTIEQLLLARFIQAVGGAAGSVVVMALLRDLFKRDDFARAISFVLLVMNLAPLAAPVIGGYLLLLLGWESIFVVLSVLAIALVVAIGFWIGETLPAAERDELNLKQSLRTYGSILKDRQCMAYQMIGVCCAAALFAFLTGSPYVYIEFFQVPAQHFGFFFGMNVVAMMVITTLNARYVARFGSHRMLGFGLKLAALGALLLVVARVFQLGDIWGVVVPVLLIMGPMGLIGANATGLALDAISGSSGSVVAVGGFLRFAAGALVGAVMGIIHTESPWALVLTMAVSMLFALLLYQLQPFQPDSEILDESGEAELDSIR